MPHKLQCLLDNLLNAVFDVHGKLFCCICGESLDPQRVGDIFYCIYWEQRRSHSSLLLPSGVLNRSFQVTAAGLGLQDWGWQPIVRLGFTFSKYIGSSRYTVHNDSPLAALDAWN